MARSIVDESIERRAEESDDAGEPNDGERAARDGGGGGCTTARFIFFRSFGAASGAA